MSESLRARTIRGLLWSAVHQFGLQAVQLATAIVLARMLLPAEFGKVAMLAIFIGLAQSFVDSGLGTALIQKKDADHVDSATVFYFNLVASVLLAGILCAMAPAIARFYREPQLTLLTRVLSIVLVINAFGLVQTNLLTKRIDFKAQTLATILAAVGGGAVGIFMAYRGFGVWSLALQSIVSSVVRTALLWFATDWRPSWTFSVPALRQMFSFGSRVLASGILGTIVENLHSVVIGKLFAATELGLYTQARRLQESPTAGVSTVVSRVAFPVFAEIQDDPVRVKSAMRRSLTTLVFLNFPLMIGLAACAKPLVILLLTEKWLPSVPYLQLLCVSGLIYPVHAINLSLLTAMGRSDLLFRTQLVKNALWIIGAAVSWPFGVMGLICGQIFASIISVYLNCYYTRVLIGYGFGEQLIDLGPYLLVAAGTGLLVYGVMWNALSETAMILVAQTILGAVVYAALCRLLNLSALMDGIALLRGSFLTSRSI